MHLRRKRTTRFLFLLCCFAPGFRPVLAGDLPVPCPPRELDQVWLVSCRHLPMDCPAEAPAFHYCRRDACGRWQTASAEQFATAAQPDAVTCVWVHGNRIESEDAGWVGTTVYDRISGTVQRPPLRFVIWSWPSERAPGRPVVEARVKLDRTDSVGYYLASFLDRQGGSSPTSLVGYSFGARSVAAALHVLAGGNLQGRSLRRASDDRWPIHAALVASAMECNTLWPGNVHGLAVQRCESILLVNNSCDRLLAHFEALGCRRHGAEAVGHSGLAVGMLGEHHAVIWQIDAADEVGKRHDWQRYFDGGRTLTAIRRAALAAP